MKKRYLTMMATGILAIGVAAGTAHAALIVGGADLLGNKLIYDEDLNITWYDFTKSEDIWEKQKEWADRLEVKLDRGTYNDWRLPVRLAANLPPDSFSKNSSEIGHLYYIELNNKGIITDPPSPSINWGFKNVGPFENLLSSTYWLGTDYTPNPDYAYFFNFGTEWALNKTSTFPALAVRDGDVTAVPVPATLLLLGTGVVGLAGARMRRRSHRPLNFAI